MEHVERLVSGALLVGCVALVIFLWYKLPQRITNTIGMILGTLSGITIIVMCVYIIGYIASEALR